MTLLYGTKISTAVDFGHSQFPFGLHAQPYSCIYILIFHRYPQYTKVVGLMYRCGQHRVLERTQERWTFPSYRKADGPRGRYSRVYESSSTNSCSGADQKREIESLVWMDHGLLVIETMNAQFLSRSCTMFPPNNVQNVSFHVGHFFNYGYPKFWIALSRISSSNVLVYITKDSEYLNTCSTRCQNYSVIRHSYRQDPELEAFHVKHSSRFENPRCATATMPIKPRYI